MRSLSTSFHLLGEILAAITHHTTTVANIAHACHGIGCPSSWHHWIVCNPATAKIIMNNPMTYIQNGDYLIPDLKLSQQPEKPLGKYGRMRKTYLKEHRPILYNQMLLSEKLYPHLIEIDETAQSRLEQMIPQLAKEAGATEELKASDPMKWVGLMNTCKAQAEEILMAELINS